MKIGEYYRNEVEVNFNQWLRRFICLIIFFRGGHQRLQNNGLKLYSCFEKGFPTKTYTTMPKGIMGSWGSWSLIEALGVTATVEGNSTNKCIYAFSFLVGKQCGTQSINT